MSKWYGLDSGLSGYIGDVFGQAFYIFVGIRGMFWGLSSLARGVVWWVTWPVVSRTSDGGFGALVSWLVFLGEQHDTVGLQFSGGGDTLSRTSDVAHPCPVPCASGRGKFKRTSWFGIKELPPT